MKSQSSLLIAVGVCALLLAGPAHSGKLCLKVSFNKLKEKVSTKSIVAASCPGGYKELIDTASLKGATGTPGSAGAPGANGLLDLASCRTLLDQNSLISGANDVSSITLSCTQNEFLLTHAGSTNDLTSSVIGVILLYWPFAGFLTSRGA